MRSGWNGIEITMGETIPSEGDGVLAIEMF